MSVVDVEKTLTTQPVGNKGSIPWFKVCLLLIAASFSSYVCAIVIGKIGNLYKLPLEFVDMPLTPSREYMVRYDAAYREMLSGNYIVNLSMFGAILGITIGMVGAVKNRVGSIVASSIGGSIGGAIVAAGVGFFLGRIAAYCIGKDNGGNVRLFEIPIEPFLQTTALR